ncbi:hypothetical protein Ahy_B02g059801 isoform G [Arachis hypogaea]|uniref:Uncharacterized protein n=1 Tax=Arachis hypogaea TaxID=3818 RepID=A0A445AH88_ARAHY|nr:hypothetical protein Ahy_B02g059801 isoform G [Arachis hypogaea]
MISLSFKAVCEDSSRVEKSIPPFTQQDQQQFVFRCSAAADVPLFLCLVPLLLSFTLPKRSRVSKNRMKDSVNYQIISPKDLAKSVLSSIIEFTREDVEALLNEKAKRKDRFNYKVSEI